MGIGFYNRIRGELDKLERDKTMKVFRHLQGPMSGRAQIEGYGDTIILCSNNYIGLESLNNPMNHAHAQSPQEVLSNICVGVYIYFLLSYNMNHLR